MSFLWRKESIVIVLASRKQTFYGFSTWMTVKKSPNGFQLLIFSSLKFPVSFFGEPNRWSIQALTDSEILTISKENYKQLCDEFPKWNEIEKRFLAKCFAMLEDRADSHLTMISYAFSTKVGTFVYNLVHHKLLAIGILVIGFWLGNSIVELTGIILFGHASMDRIFGYRLKYPDDFKHTHLGWIGK